MKRVVVLFFLYLPISIYAQWLGSGATSGCGDMYYNGGYVGIGYSHPSYKLDVNGIFRAKDYIYLGRVGTDGRGIKADDGVGATIFSITRNPYNEIRFQGYGDLTFFTNGNTGTEKLRITKTGNVGIGTTSPSYKLDVDGIVRAEEIKVQNVPASDYVFEPNYHLKPIEEVETFIKENKHLPDIPSAEEFKENGVGLGEMDNMLLRKVEELTLYMIDMQKQMDELKEENAALKEQITH